ncbi:NAD(P)/FAD-dependent oxidoreductase [Aliigemmobacter aestuarii]|uniref:NAD(P)/FAD-dependent oxidoreductase n=1 Tax=Aliigemmobacter aestuarii TaxID=1445661 RepID=UPI001454E1BE|nr:FAD-dependent oxidoreductase [Gemmobacter aestuarii]
MSAPHVAIVGAGVIGAAVAFRLARAGARVTVVDAGLPAAQASGRSFGWINASFFLNAAHFALRSEAMAAHHRLDADLPHGTTTWPGCLWWEETGEAFDRTEARLRGLGYPVAVLDRQALAARLPHMAAIPDRALHFPTEGVTDTARLTRRLLAASGAEVWTGCPVTGVETASGRACGLRLASGRIGADHVVLAAGTGTPDLLAPLGIALALPDRPGVLVATRPLARVLDPVIVTPDQEIRQDAAGRLIAPAAASHQSDRADRLAAPPGVLADATIERLRAMFPGQAIALESATVGWRPVPADGLPVIGAAPLPGLWLAVMHSGATLCALAGEIMAAMILKGETHPLAAPFAATRPGLDRITAG